MKLTDVFMYRDEPYYAIEVSQEPRYYRYILKKVGDSGNNFLIISEKRPKKETVQDREWFKHQKKRPRFRE